MTSVTLCECYERLSIGLGWRQFMTMKTRVLLCAIVACATMWMPGCGHYTCGVTFGGSCAGSGGSGIGSTGGNGTGSATAFAFAVNEAGHVDGFTLTSGTAPSFAATASYTAPAVPTNLEGSGMVVAQSQYLYSVFSGTGQIFGWTIDSSGGLTPITGSPFSAGYLIGTPGGGTRSVITSPDGTLLFVLDSSGMSIYVYQIGTGGTLTLVNGSPFAVPFFPGNMGTDGLGKYLYVV